MNEERLFNKIEEDVKILAQQIKTKSPGELDSKWDYLTSVEPKKFINKDLTVNKDILRNFRKYQVFISDRPGKYGASSPFLMWSGTIRGVKKLLIDCYNVIEENGFRDLLLKHPIFNIGNPTTFTYKGCNFTYRWTKHIYFLGQFNKVFKDKINNDFIGMDVGSSYGIFSSLLKKEYPKSTQVLLDFPEQLILAHYFIGKEFPEAKIAGFKELINAEKIDREFIKQFDFVLLPWFWFDKVRENSIDLLTNFASFGEMRREWFDFYLKSDLFKTVKYLFTANRFQSYPTYDTDITILDYPLNEFDKIHFGICPIFSHDYLPNQLFFYNKKYFSSQYFEFFGVRNNS
ncbi:putative sugar O-methyltransferase [bacterium]